MYSYRIDRKEAIAGSLGPEDMQALDAYYRGQQSGGVGRLVADCIAWYKHWREVRQASDQLMAMDDRLLADIGVSRAEIEAVVRNGVTHVEGLGVNENRPANVVAFTSSKAA